ncbi:hypothetical protein ACFL12_03390 [Pseudomonadota bacterium]
MVEIRRFRANDEDLRVLIARYMTTLQTSSADCDLSVLDITFASNDPIQVNVSYQSHDGHQYSHDMDRDELIGAFIQHCLDESIPICRNSMKTVSKTDDGLAFDMVILAQQADADDIALIKPDDGADSGNDAEHRC